MDPLSGRSILYGIPTTPPNTTDYNTTDHNTTQCSEIPPTPSPNTMSEFPSIALPAYPSPLRRPIYICGHTCDPLPVTCPPPTKKPYRTPFTPRPSLPPLVFLHPCRLCHYTFTENLVADIFNRFQQNMDDTDAELKQLDKVLEKGYMPDESRRRDALRIHKAQAMELRRGEIKEVWEAFKAVWGNWGQGNEGGEAGTRTKRGKDGILRNF